MITIILLIGLSFILFGFFAGSEMAYLSCNKLKLRHLADQGDRRAQSVMRFYKNPKQFLTTVLVGTNIMHVTIAALVVYLLERHFHISNNWTITIILALFIIIFAETIPKDWFRHKADEFIYRFAAVLGFLDRLLSGFSRILTMLTDFLLNITTRQLSRNPFVTREEFRYVIEESTKGGVLLEHEKQMINSILNLSSRTVEEVMTPLSRFAKVSLLSTIGEVKSTARKNKSDAFLVYEEIPSLVVGLIYVFDVLFEDNDNAYLSKYLRSPLFIPHDTSLEKALVLLQAKRVTYAAIINPDREVIGVVSVENLIQL